MKPLVIGPATRILIDSYATLMLEAAQSEHFILDFANARPVGPRLSGHSGHTFFMDDYDHWGRSDNWGEPRCSNLVSFPRFKPDWESPLPHERSGPQRSVERIEARGLPPRHPTKGFRRAHKKFRKTSRT